METEVTNNPVVAIAGVTGAVGAEFIAVMDKRGFPVGKLKALASKRSAGKQALRRQAAHFPRTGDRDRRADRKVFRRC